MTNEQKEKIIRFRRQGMSFANISRELGISKDTVKSFCRRTGVPTPDKKSTEGTALCRECGVPIVQQEKKKRRIFCCKACREKWWAEHAYLIHQKAIYTFTCAECGKVFTAYGNSKRKYCSHACYIVHRFGGASND